MLTDSNEDSLLARIEERGARPSTIPLKTSYQSLGVHASTLGDTNSMGWYARARPHAHVQKKTTTATTKTTKTPVF